MMRKLIFTVMVLVLWFVVVTVAVADDYHWIKNTAEEDEAQLIPVDPKICKLYEENLRYFAHKNTLMSCYRPIAPHLKDRIKEVEWEDLDPGSYSTLFRAIVMEYGYLSKKSEDVIQESVKYARDRVAEKIRVFRRAKLTLIGRIRTPAFTVEPESYWIVQYGPNNVSQSNPDEFYRCIPLRGGRDEFNRNLRLYVVSEAKKELTKSLSYLLHPSNEGQYLRQIDGRLFVENIRGKAWIGLNEVDTSMPMTDRVCNFKFKKSSKRGK